MIPNWHVNRLSFSSAQLCFINHRCSSGAYVGHAAEMRRSMLIKISREASHGARCRYLFIFAKYFIVWIFESFSPQTWMGFFFGGLFCPKGFNLSWNSLLYIHMPAIQFSTSKIFISFQNVLSLYVRLRSLTLCISLGLFAPDLAFRLQVFPPQPERSS